MWTAFAQMMAGGVYIGMICIATFPDESQADMAADCWHDFALLRHIKTFYTDSGISFRVTPLVLKVK